ncbi:MAG TPA: hypothetical protein PKA28_10655 [Methylomusa anaerophila]|uniref:Uncharacterized protein n=1 Tax=Methylomusa anaerophila TaxID=1930071 RepID=A0A348AIX6_9FIRM|nr:hypothetical protein [Methylomusa anaerophila]BBB91024.1 hypothetical protein MAMMFC1_01692 [Methylomusa anaerophila]HML88894.1 hypothetical protein [Methylomusa anaerophila]
MKLEIDISDEAYALFQKLAEVFNQKDPAIPWSAAAVVEIMAEKETRRRLVNRKLLKPCEESLTPDLSFCSNPAKPAAAPGNECQKSRCCVKCPEPCNSQQPCRHGRFE